MIGQRTRHKDPAIDNDFRNIHENLRSMEYKVGDVRPYFFADGVTASSELNTPTNWFICNGKELSCSEYSQLFSLLGFRYGSGLNGLTFKLPNITALDTYFGWIIKGK